MIKLINSKICVERKFLEKYYSNAMIRKNVSLGKFLAIENSSYICYKSVLETNAKVTRESAKKDLPSCESLVDKLQTVEIKKEVAKKYQEKTQENIYISLIQGFYKPNREVYFAGEYGAEFAYDFTRASAWLDFLLDVKTNKALSKKQIAILILKL